MPLHCSTPPERIERMVDGLLRILRAVTVDAELPVGDIDLLGDGERELVLREWNGSDAPVPAGTLDSLFADQVVRSPGAVAIVDESMALTYRQFDARVDAGCSVSDRGGCRGPSRGWRWRCGGHWTRLSRCTRWSVPVVRMCRSIRMIRRSGSGTFWIRLTGCC